jgi:hypothetical protein
MRGPAVEVCGTARRRSRVTEGMQGVREGKRESTCSGLATVLSITPTPRHLHLHDANVYYAVAAAMIKASKGVSIDNEYLRPEVQISVPIKLIQQLLTFPP